MAGGNHVFDTDELFARGAVAGTGNLCLFNFLPVAECDNVDLA